MMSSPAGPRDIPSAFRNPFRSPRSSPSSSPKLGHSSPVVAGRSPRVIRFGDEVEDDVEMATVVDQEDTRGLRDGKKEQVWVQEMLQELSRLGWRPTAGDPPKSHSSHRSAAHRPPASILATSPNFRGSLSDSEFSSSASSSRQSSFSSSTDSSPGSYTPPVDSILRNPLPPSETSPRRHNRSNSLSLPHSHRLNHGAILNTAPLTAIASSAPGSAAADLARQYTVNAGTSGGKASHARRMSAAGRLEVVREEKED